MGDDQDIPEDKRKSKKRVREEVTPATEASQKQRKPVCYRKVSKPRCQFLNYN